MKPAITFPNTKGFTLIEVIIAMTLLSLILVLLFSTIFTVNRSWQTTEIKIAHNEDIRLVSHFIRRQISQNIPLMWVHKKEQKLIFTGTNDELSFTTTLPAHRGGGGVQIITLKVNETDNTRHLDLYYRHANPDNSPFAQSDNTEQVTLLKNIKNIELAYFGQEKINETPSWRDEWQHNKMLPTLISLKIYAINASQDWPEIKIPLHVNHINGQPQFILRKTKEAPI